MKLRAVFLGAVAAAAVVSLALLAACSGPGQGEEGVPSDDDVVVVGGEGIVTVTLDYSAGTGYEWDCSLDGESVLSIVSSGEEDLAADDVTGGPLQHTVTMRAASPGHAVLTCRLVRGWENGDPAETQVFDFTVDDDLQITFNDKDSSYVNAPEWGSNS